MEQTSGSTEVCELLWDVWLQETFTPSVVVHMCHRAAEAPVGPVQLCFRTSAGYGPGEWVEFPVCSVPGPVDLPS